MTKASVDFQDGEKEKYLTTIVSDQDTYDIDDPHNYTTDYVDEHNPRGLRIPSPSESENLRRVLGRVAWPSYFIFIAEFAERASYYSVTGILSNFIQRPLPKDSPHNWGAPPSTSSSESAGALGRGLQMATALTLLLTFLAYVVPLFGGFVADTKLGKFKAIMIGVLLGFLSHVLFIIAAIPSVMLHSSGGLAVCILAILTLAVGTGFIKPNLLPLLMDQYPHKTDLVKVLPSGESVILDRQKTLERLTLVFYWAINIGAFMQLATSYCERRVGFWFAFFIPIIVYLIIPFVFFFLRPRLLQEEIQGSVLTNSWRIVKVTFSGGFIKRWRAQELWDYARPTKMIERGRNYYNEKKKTPISWDDQWVLDVKQTFNACKIFIFFPIYNLGDGGIGSVQTSLAGSMSLLGVPNDLFQNFNPLTIIILIPILDNLIYPLLRRFKLDFKPVHRICLGFFLAAVSNVASAVIQHRVYNTSPCGNQATNCPEPSPISAWQMVSVYILAAASECFANTTAYELAYTRSPPHMKGLVMALFLFTTAISSAISEAVTPALIDPYLVWPQAAIAIACAVFGILFGFVFRNLHVEKEGERVLREKLLDEKQRNAENVHLEAITSLRSIEK